MTRPAYPVEEVRDDLVGADARFQRLADAGGQFAVVEQRRGSFRDADFGIRRAERQGDPFGLALDGGQQLFADIVRIAAHRELQLAAVGASDGTALTTWRLEGPSGPFGPEIERLVAFSVPPFVAGESTVERIPANAGIAGGTAWNVVVRVRNAGSEAWTRDGDDAVYLGLRRSTAPGWTGEGWINERVATKMLEREAAPGEWASFAFRVRGGQGSFEVQPFRTSGWSEGDPATVSLG